MMKKILLLMTFGVFSNLNAQTIVESDLPNLGNVVIEYMDTSNTSAYSVSAPGTGQSWNFTSMFSVDDTSGFVCLAPSSIPWNAAVGFPNSEFGNYNTNDSTAAFYSSNNSGFYLDGYYSVTPQLLDITTISFTNKRLMVPVPFSINNVRNHSSYFEIETQYPMPPPDSFVNIRLRNYLIQTFTADASGSLTTLAGTFPSSLRIKELNYTIDSTWMDVAGNGIWTLTDANGPHDTAVYYRWFANGLPGYRMQLEVNPNTNQVIGASIFDNDFVLKTSNLNSAKFEMFPNPTSGFFTIRNACNQTLTITNLMGDVLQTQNLMNSIETINLTEFPVGIYFVKLTDGKGNNLVQKITKQ